MFVQLSSPVLKISINNKGAEICSVKNNDGLEFIWQANKEVWARHAPVLFPIVGKLKNNEFVFDNKSYQLPQHGFARDLEFEIISQTKNNCVYQLNSNAETKKNYPFDFVFEIKHQLIDNTLTTTYTVKNPGHSQIYFSVGAHPGFNCPLLPTEKFEDYYLEFETSDYHQTQLNNGLRLNTKKELHLKDGKLPLSGNLFDHDALVFEDSQINAISLCSYSSAHKITLNCKSWPFFGIWSTKKCERFVCLEPWFGIADAEDNNGSISNKTGIIALKPFSEFSCSFSVSFS
jgi:galactose mutarotase-like enzyme